MSEWLTEHRAFNVETFFQNNDSYTHTIHAFRKYVAIAPKKPVPTKTTVKT